MTTYEQNYQIELINELSESVCGLFFNALLKKGINPKDMEVFESKLLTQLEVNKNDILYDKPLEELLHIKKYWQTMNVYTKEIFINQTVA